MLNIASAQDLPVLCLEQGLYLFFIGVLLLTIPSLEETHLTVDEHSMSTLSVVGDSLSFIFAFPKDFLGNGEDVPDSCESVLLEVGPDTALRWLRLVVALEVEDPEGIEMGVDGHVESIGPLAFLVFLAVLVHGGGVAGITGGCECSGDEEKEKRNPDVPVHDINQKMVNNNSEIMRQPRHPGGYGSLHPSDGL